MFSRFISIVCILLVLPVSGMQLPDGQEVSYCVYHNPTGCMAAPCLTVEEDGTVTSKPYGITHGCPYKHPQQLPVLSIYDKDINELGSMQPGQNNNQGSLQQFLQNVMPQQQQAAGTLLVANQLLTHQQAMRALEATSETISKRMLEPGNENYKPKIKEWWLQRWVTDTPWRKEVQGLIQFKDDKGLPRAYALFPYKGTASLRENFLKAKNSLAPYMDLSACENNGTLCAPHHQNTLSWHKNYKNRLAEITMMIPILAGTLYAWHFQKKKINPVLEKLNAEKDPEKRQKIMREITQLAYKKVKIILGTACTFGVTIAVVLKLLSKRDPLLFESSK